MADLLERLKTALSGRYEIESEIGRGGMATVYLALDLKHRRKVAIKVLHPELTATLGSERFLQEIEIVAGLQHPHILPLYDSGEADGLLYYVMPYAAGESLRHRLDRERQLAVDESVRITVEVADALDYAHRQGVVHRDIKPGNVLLSEGHAVIADFGIARAIEVARAERVTSTGLGVGTPLYSSPEQATAQETLDGRTDIYSLACVLYEMLAGEPPLTGSTPQMIRARRLAETPTALHALRDTVPPALDQVITRALARVPADRYATASQFGQALQAVMFTGTPVWMADSAATPAALSVTPRVVASPSGKRVVGLLVAGAVVVIVAVGFWFASRQETRADAEAEYPVSSRAEFREVQLTFTGDVLDAAISPDGEQVAYCRRVATDDSGAELVKLMLAPVAEPEAPRELASLEYCDELRWLADGSEVAVRTVLEGRFTTVGVSRYGGALRQLPCRSGYAEAGLDQFVLSPDGSRCATQSREYEYIVVRSSDGAVPPDTIFPESEHEYVRPVGWLPGDRLSFETGTDPGFGTIWTARPDGSDRDSIASFENRFFRWWSADGRALYYVPGGPAGSDVMRLEIGEDGKPDGESRLLLSQLDGAADLTFSADGRRAILTRGATHSRIVRISAAEATGSTEGVATTVVDWTEGLWAPRLSNNGEWIAYSSPDGLFKIPVVGGKPTMLSTRGVFRVDWSPDDRFLAYARSWKDTNRLWILHEDQHAPAMVEGEVDLGVMPRWLGSYLTVPRRESRNEFRILDSLRAWDYEQEQWVPLLEGDVSAIDLRRGVKARGTWQTATDSITRWFNPNTISPDGRQLLVDWNRTLDGSRATDSTTHLTNWLISLDTSDRTRIPTINGLVRSWTEDGLYVLRGSGIYLQDLDGDSSRLILEWPGMELRGVNVRHSIPVEVVGREQRSATDAWLIEILDPDVN